jgi:FKBP-type peptidyl-prolyl cis-trans isomerase
MNKTNLILVLATIIFSIGLYSCKTEAQKETDARNAYLKEHNIKVQPTASGLYYIETKTGTGIQAKKGDIVEVNYTGKFLDGKIFDSSYERNKPIKFTLGKGQVIKGWDEGISYMKEGGKATLIIPSNLAYGATGAGTIPPYTTLVFDVELVKVSPQK